VNSTRRLLIAGCGDLGIRLAGRLDGWSVTGLRRNTARLPETITPQAADLARPETLSGLAREWDAVVYTATPGERSEAGYRAAYVQGLEHLLGHIKAGRFIFVSSTAVYGQDDGEWVDEDSAAEPGAFNGRILLEAEGLAREFGGIALRFSGIYGPGRDWLLRTLRAGGVTCRRQPPVWTNRIHAEDCAGALAHLLTLEKPDDLYVASDRCPAPRWEVLSWLAARMGVPGPVESEDDCGDHRGQGKRVLADRLFGSGFALQYPDYRAGYGEMLA